MEFRRVLFRSRQLVTPVGGQLGVTQERMIDEGLALLGRLAPEDRSILALRQLLGQRDPEGIGARLEKWARGGSLGWVLDNEIDALSLVSGRAHVWTPVTNAQLVCRLMLGK